MRTNDALVAVTLIGASEVGAFIKKHEPIVAVSVNS